VKQIFYSATVPDYLLNTHWEDFICQGMKRLFTPVQAKRELAEKIITPLMFKKGQ
jgi:hypothetical protein